jgi:hypothetical protein
MPGDGIPEGQEQEIRRYLIVADGADYWAVQNNQTDEAKGDGEDKMETSEEVAVRPVEAAPDNGGQPRLELAARGLAVQNSVPL